MRVVQITAQFDPGTVELLEELLAHAKTGQLCGFAYVAELRGKCPLFGSEGSYRRNPFDAMGVLTRLWLKLAQAGESIEKKQATR